MKTKVLLGIASLFLTGTVFADLIIMDPPPGKTGTEVKEKMNESEAVSLSLGKGESVTVSLKENTTTGFQWVAEYDKTLCSVELNHCGPEQKKGELLCGAPGSVKVTMKLLTDQKAEVRLMYRRSWEKDVPPAETKIYVLTKKP